MRNRVKEALAAQTSQVGSDPAPDWPDDPMLHVTVVERPREILRFLTAAASGSALEARVAAYVREHARDQLWPGEARRVEALLAAGDTSAAIWLYFDTTGTRRDDEQLRLAESM